MVTALLDPATTRGRVVLQPDKDMSWRGFLLVFLLTNVPLVVIGVVTDTPAAWYVLPVAVTTTVIAGLGFHFARQFCGAQDIVSIGDETVCVDKSERRAAEHFEFQRCWAQVVLEAAPDDGLALTRLFIRSHGRQVELGRFLGERERRDVATRLRRLMGPTRASA